MQYEIIEDEYMGKIVTQIKAVNELGNVMWIPMDEANADYQQYLIDTDGGLSSELPTS